MALADFLKTINQPSGVTPLQSSIGQPNIPMQGKTTPSPFGDMSSGLNDRLRLMLYALGGALKGESPLQAGLGFQQFTQQQKFEEETKKRKEKLENLAKTNPNLAKMYELFGEKGLQQSYLQQQESLQEEKNRLNKVNTFINAGISYEDSVLLASGLDAEDIKLLRKDEKSSQDVIDNINKEVAKVEEQTNYQDAYTNLTEAFGPVDAIQAQLNKASRLAGFDIAKETASAVRARDALNVEILANLAADFTGRPNMLIYEEINNLLPKNSATSHKDAYEQYNNVLQKTKGRIANLEQGIRSETLSEATKEKYREELFKSKELEKKLEAATKSLKGEPEDILEPVSTISEGKYSSYFLNNSNNG